MLAAANLGFSFLDGPTLAFVMVCIIALLGLFLISATCGRSPGGAQPI